MFKFLSQRSLGKYSAPGTLSTEPSRVPGCGPWPYPGYFAGRSMILFDAVICGRSLRSSCNGKSIAGRARSYVLHSLTSAYQSRSPDR
jgi:hypothetical protein